MTVDHERKRFDVAVFGGGVAGLTAAHELAERGFDVWVFEPSVDPLSETNLPLVGGLAATQWCAVPQRRPEGSTLIQAKPISALPRRFFFKENSDQLVDGQEDAVVRFIDYFRDTGEGATRSVRLAGARDSKENRQLPNGKDLALARAETIFGLIKDFPVAPLPGAISIDDSIQDDRSEASARRVVYVDYLDEWLAGEHGYRFFPNFYHHLLETMRRIPILETERAEDRLFFAQTAFQDRLRALNPQILTEPRREEVIGRRHRPTSRTAFDNLVPLEFHLIAKNNDPDPTPLRRTRPTSFSDVFDIYRQLKGPLKFSDRDLGLFQEKIWRFMTSGEKRRRTYEDLSWEEFIDTEQYSPAFREALTLWPQALAGLRSSEGDARTHGEVSIQLILDQLQEGWTDGSLNGPTSKVWLDHWRLYLEKVQRVTFIRATLSGFKLTEAGELQPEITVPSEDLRPPLTPESLNQNFSKVGFFVVAVPLEKLDAIISPKLEATVRKELELPGRDSFLQLTALARQAALPKNDLYRDYAGIQFYLERDVRWLEGHIYLPDSPWSISLVAPSDFRQERIGGTRSLRGFISAIIGTLDKVGTTTGGKIGRDCSPQEIAREVWKQIRDGLSKLGGLPEEPPVFNIDHNLSFVRGQPVENANRYFVNAGRFGLPGRLDDRRGYEVIGRTTVFCGAHMRTYTRLSSMESANESARHAVNGILDTIANEGAGERVGSRCEVRSMIGREPRDLSVLRDLDDELFDRGLPHAADIVGIPSLLRLVLGRPTDMRP